MNCDVLSSQRKMIFFNPNILGQAQKVKICKKTMNCVIHQLLFIKCHFLTLNNKNIFKFNLKKPNFSQHIKKNIWKAKNGTGVIHQPIHKSFARPHLDHGSIMFN